MSAAKSLFASVLLTLTGGTANADPNQYLCTVEHAAGLRFDKATNTWRPQQFASKKYLLRRLTPEDRDEKHSKFSHLLDGNPKANWAFFNNEAGTSPLPLASCIEDKDAVLSQDLFCRRITADAQFDMDSRRFEIVYRGSYIQQGFWEQYRREYPEQYARQLPLGEAQDPSKPDDLFIEIGNCSPS